MLPIELSKPELALVECLRVFARRGRILRQEQAQKNQTVGPENFHNDKGQAADRQAPLCQPDKT